jgi:Aminotransferase class I and II
VAAAHTRHHGTSDDARAAFGFGLSLALILAEPVLRAHPERHVLPPGVGVVGEVTVTARRTEVAAGHRQPLGGTGFLLADERPLDADIAVDRTPIGAIQGLDSGRVAHVGTTAKTFAPGLRLGWISAPADLVDDLQARKSAAGAGSPAIDQLALASLLTAGEYQRHIVRARHAYRRRRDLLLRALTARFPAMRPGQPTRPCNGIRITPCHVRTGDRG